MRKVVSFIPAAALLCVALLLSSCGSTNGSRKSASRASAAVEEEVLAAEEEAPMEEAAEPLHSFPLVSIPMMYSDDADATSSYVLEHYWDSFFATDASTTASSILGVSDEDVEQALANYIGILQQRKALATPDATAPLEQATKSVSAFFRKLEKKQQADTSSLVYLRMTELVSRYLYDPNSPMRDEDLYLPFVEAAAISPCTADDMRTAYKYESSICRTNRFGKKVPDVKYCKADGKKGTLYGVKADYTMLFFSNPGCNSCKEIINEVMSRRYIDQYISEGRLAIVNIYIDSEVSKWRDYVHNYPASWINGYDYTFKLRESGLYGIRAIPSLYLLDSQKRVLMKDAPTENVLSFLDRI